MHVSRCAAGRFLRVALVAALAALTLVVPALAAQDADEAHPAHIHSGTCAELGDVVVPLVDVALPEGDRVGPASGLPVELSENTVDMPLQEIIDGGHAINIHLSAAEIDTYIACGDIGGILTTQEDGEGQELTVGLGELNNSGYTGVAWLGSNGDQTLLQIELFKLPLTSASAEASPVASAAAAAQSVAVEIKNFSFNPPQIDVPVGGSLTWTNQDNVPHTATAMDKSVLQSGSIPFGKSFTAAFSTPGTYDYFCEFHPNMKGTIVVK